MVIGNASQPDMQRVSDFDSGKLLSLLYLLFQAVKIFGSHGKTACEVIDLEKAGNFFQLSEI